MNRTSQQGSALLIVMLALVIVSSVGIAMVYTGQGDHLAAANERDAERAAQASRAGLNFAYQQFTDSLLVPTPTGALFNSLAPTVSAALKGANFEGLMFDDSSSTTSGQVYRILSTGTFNRAVRTTEIVLQIVPEAFRFGYTAFNQATLHNHSGLAGPSFKIESTVFSNGDVEIPSEITLDGSIVSAGTVQIKTNATVKGHVFANAINHQGLVIEGNAKTLTAVERLPASATSWARVDSHGTKYDWFDGIDTPGSIGGSGTILGTQSSYTVQNNDLFRTSIFRQNGKMDPNPNLNAVQFVAPPRPDYRAMKAAADGDDPTYFATMNAAMTYLASKKVVEVIAGKTLTTIRVGTTSNPEYIFVDDDFELRLNPSIGADNTATGVLKADGFHLEGGIYASGDIQFNGPAFNPALHPAPPDYYQFKINALPYCMPAIVAYPTPSTGSIATWGANDAPVMTGGQSKLTMKSETSPHEGFALITGVVYAEGDIHLHHTQSANELIRFIGAEMAYKVHNCDFFWFTFDPSVACTRFLVAEEGVPRIVSFREVR